MLWNRLLHAGLPQLDEALVLFRDALAGGSAKAQWNACYAIGSSLKTSAAAAALAASPSWRELLLLLTSIAASCPNFKVHIWEKRCCRLLAHCPSILVIQRRNLAHLLCTIPLPCSAS